MFIYYYKYWLCYVKCEYTYPSTGPKLPGIKDLLIVAHLCRKKPIQLVLVCNLHFCISFDSMMKVEVIAISYKMKNKYATLSE